MSLIFLVAFSLQTFSQTWTPGSGIMYMNPTTTKVGIGVSSPERFLHIANGDLKIGLNAGAYPSSNRLLFGDGEYIQIGEMLNDDQLAFKAKNFVFLPSSTGYNGYDKKNID